MDESREQLKCLSEWKYDVRTFVEIPVTVMNPRGLYDPSANGYSHVAAVEAGTRLVFIARQGGESEQEALEPGFQPQVRQARNNVRVLFSR